MSHLLESSHQKVTVGTYLAKRIIEAGTSHFFTVPGDFTLALLDQFINEPELNIVGCCNELNAGYAADGYCRATGGLGVVMGSFTILQTLSEL